MAHRIFIGLGLVLLLGACKKATPESSPAIPNEFVAVANKLEIQDPPTDPNLKRLIAAYPEFLLAADGNAVVWKDGTVMPWDDGKAQKTFAELEHDPDLQDMFAYAYRKDSLIFRENVDPGRIRNEAFFKKMYGQTAADVGRNLMNINWLGGAQTLRITRINGVDKALEAVSKELMQSPTMQKYLTNPGGTFNWRVIAGTDRLSAHSFGMAVDINVGYSDYWRWSAEFKAGKPLVYHNQIPQAIVDVFERHGFIWGGRWYHYDTMHFEYRPELL